MTKTLDVPYGANFHVEESWIIEPVDGSTNKCKLTVTCWTVILKPFMMQKMAEGRAAEGLKEDIEIWFEEVKKVIKKDQ